MPANSAPTGLGWDKLNHSGAMAAITGAAYLSFKSRYRGAGLAFFYSISIGILIEIMQATLTNSRVAEWSDIYADLFGSGLAWITIKVYQRLSAQNP